MATLEIFMDNLEQQKSRKVLLSVTFIGLIVLIAIVLVVTGLSYLNKSFSQAGIFDFLFKNRPESVFESSDQEAAPYQSVLSLEQAVINVVKNNANAVVSVIQTKNVPILERCFRTKPFGDVLDDPLFKRFFGDAFELQVPDVCERGSEQIEVGGGTGFVIGSDGLIVTNKHVVIDTDSQYTVLTNEGKKLEAEVLARDPFQDFAILKIESFDLPTVKLGNSDSIEIGQFVVAIGNALGEFRNTVSVGVVSGIRNNIAASGAAGFQEVLDEVIQTDAAINPGNSGGPLLNLRGEVIGINTAIARGAQNIGFTIPINKIKRSINSFQTTGKIVYPFLGVRYVIVNTQIQKERDLDVDYGALLESSDSQPAVVEDSAAQEAGLKAGDIILEINNQRIDEQRTLAKLIQRYQPGQVVKIKVLRGDKELLIDIKLGEKTS